MAEFSELQLDRADTLEAAPERSRLGPLILAAALIVLTLAVSAAYLLWPRRSAESPASRLYATLKPRVGEALRDVGDPRGDADATLRRAILELLATPVIEARIPLAQPGVMYAFEDPALESLSAAQRQLLRMGPRNARIVQQKLREIAPYLGIDLSAEA